MAEMTYDGTYGVLLSKLTEMEQRLSLLEIQLSSEMANARKICTACDVRLDPTNATERARIAELCDSCWDMLNVMQDEAEVGF
jgi:hypothetical protein